MSKIFNLLIIGLFVLSAGNPSVLSAQEEASLKLSPEAEKIYIQAVADAQNGRYAEAAAAFQKLAAQMPEARVLRQNLSQTLAQWGEDLAEKKDLKNAALQFQAAVEADPENGPAWFRLGDLAYLDQNRFQFAVDCWKKALPLAPDDIRVQIVSRISRAELDQRLERGYQVLNTAHFEIRYPEDFLKSEAERIGAYLEKDYAVLAAQLGIQPSKLTLVIYPQTSFDRLVGGHEGTLGLYDGRIRIGAREVGTQFEKLILSHELAHAFLQHTFGSHLPIWIQEGYAQTREPERYVTEEHRRIERQLADGNGWVPLKWLDRKFSQPMNSTDVTRAYLQAYQVVAYLMQEGEKEGFQAFLRQIQQGKPLPEAFRRAYPKLSWNAVEHGRLKD